MTVPTRSLPGSTDYLVDNDDSHLVADDATPTVAPPPDPSVYTQAMRLISGFVLIDGYPVDITKSETYTFQNETTDEPLESGVDVTDHIIIKPETISLECVVSNAPVGRIAQDPSRSTDASAIGVAQDAFNRMVALRNARKIFTVVTRRGAFANMTIERLEEQRNAASGASMIFTLQLKHLRFVSNERTTVRGAGKQSNLGSGGAAKVFKGITYVMRFLEDTSTAPGRAAYQARKRQYGQEVNHVIDRTDSGKAVTQAANQGAFLSNKKPQTPSFFHYYVVDEKKVHYMGFVTPAQDSPGDYRYTPTGSMEGKPGGMTYDASEGYGGKWHYANGDRVTDKTTREGLWNYITDKQPDPPDPIGPSGQGGGSQVDIPE